MKILAIETSCDETSIALIEKLENSDSVLSYKILSHETISQINLHREHGGVYPQLARREHEKNLVPLLHKVLSDTNMLEVDDLAHERIIEILGADIELLERYPDLKENVFDFFSKFRLKKDIEIDFIAVTNGPGLPPALWVGVNFSKIVAMLLSKTSMNRISIYPINHMEGHIVGGISQRVDNIIALPQLGYPVLALLISGGHTELVLSRESQKYEKIGETQDDACGEAYDKVARMLGLPYPGGPEIGKLAKIGREKKNLPLNFPRPMIYSKDLNFSFSGIKTHILYFLQKLVTINEDLKIQVATEFEEVVKDILIYKTKKAVGEYNIQTLVVGGGVASNSYLKEIFQSLAKELSIELFYSAKDLATDNALMIALTCALQIESKKSPSLDFIARGSRKYEWS